MWEKPRTIPLRIWCLFGFNEFLSVVWHKESASVETAYLCFIWEIERWWKSSREVERFARALGKYEAVWSQIVTDTSTLNVVIVTHWENKICLIYPPSGLCSDIKSLTTAAYYYKERSMTQRRTMFSSEPTHAMLLIGLWRGPCATRAGAQSSITIIALCITSVASALALAMNKQWQ